MSKRRLNLAWMTVPLLSAIATANAAAPPTTAPAAKAKSVSPQGNPPIEFKIFDRPMTPPVKPPTPDSKYVAFAQATYRDAPKTPDSGDIAYMKILRDYVDSKLKRLQDHQDREAFGRLFEKEILRHMRRTHRGTDVRGRFVKMRFFASSPEEVKRLAQAFLTALIDHQRAGGQDLRAKLKKSEKELDDRRKELVKAQADFERVDAQFKKLEPMPKEVHVAFATRSWTLRAEMAGVKGKLRAADKLLASDDIGPAVKAGIEQVKVEAEIELAGLTEQGKVVREFQAAYQHYMDVRNKCFAARRLPGVAEKAKREAGSRVAVLKKLVDQWARPVIEPVEIRPVK